ncbi:hypothetical protein NQB76_03860 [Escherichia coli]|nr:hypothetical protein NQB76_03860 [Escherichia coli]
MSSILEIFFPLCASDTVRWQRRTPDVEHGIWPDVADEQLSNGCKPMRFDSTFPANGSASGRLNCLMSPASRYRLFCPPCWKKS